jgi:hypothetical protein
MIGSSSLRSTVGARGEPHGGGEGRAGHAPSSRVGAGRAASLDLDRLQLSWAAAGKPAASANAKASKASLKPAALWRAGRMAVRQPARRQGGRPALVSRLRIAFTFTSPAARQFGD